jgi:hypothetical protein
MNLYLAIIEYVNNLNYYFNFKLMFAEEIIIIFIFYNFIKLIVFGSIVELVWPTQFFNRRHNCGFQLIKYRTYTETLLKLRSKTINYKVFNKSLLKFFFIKN